MNGLFLPFAISLVLSQTCLKCSLLVPFLHGGWDNVHGVNSSHKLGGDSSGKEVDQDILISDSTEGSIVFEF